MSGVLFSTTIYPILKVLLSRERYLDCESATFFNILQPSPSRTLIDETI
jgi:hypothetical protein